MRIKIAVLFLVLWVPWMAIAEINEGVSHAFGDDAARGESQGVGHGGVTKNRAILDSEGERVFNEGIEDQPLLQKTLKSGDSQVQAEQVAQASLQGSEVAQPQKHWSPYWIICGMVIIQIPIVLQIYFKNKGRPRAQQKGAEDDLTVRLRFDGAKADPSSAENSSSPPLSSPHLSVWTTSYCEPCAIALGLFFSMALSLWPALPWEGGIGDGVILCIKEIALLLASLALLLLLRHMRARRDYPILATSTAGAICQSGSLLIPWRQIKGLSLKQRRDGKTNRPVPDSYDLNINYLNLKAPGAELVEEVPLVDVSMSAHTVLQFLKTCVNQAISRGGKGSGEIESLAYRAMPRSGIPWLDDGALLLLIIFSTLAFYGFSAGWEIWGAFNKSSDYQDSFGGYGSVVGLLMFLMLVPQRLRVNRQLKKGTGTLIGWGVKMLLVSVFLLGYISVDSGIPGLINRMIGTPYSTQYAMVSKHYIAPAHRQHKECYSIYAQEIHGAKDGEFCVKGYEYSAMQKGHTLTFSGKKSWFGTQLYDFRVDPVADHSRQ